jgi:mono/diheme cytochrome c family protein
MGKRITFGAIFLLLSLSVVERVHARHGGQAQRNARLGLQTKPAATDEDRDKLLAVGKKIFVERCAKCHDGGRR